MPAQAKGVINNWAKRHTSARQQAQAISFLFDRIEYYEKINFHVPFNRIFEECSTNCNISKATARRFWLHFEKYGELPAAGSAAALRSGRTIRFHVDRDIGYGHAIVHGAAAQPLCDVRMCQQ